MMKRLYGTDGIRGEANVELTPELALRASLAIGTFFKKKRQTEVLVGHDGRIGSPMVTHAIVSGLLAVGCNVEDIGVAPTPVIQFAARYFKKPAVIATASHNPPPYLGLKSVTSEGIETSRSDERVIEDIFFSQKFDFAPWNVLGHYSMKVGVFDIYKESVKTHVDVEAIAKKRFRIVIDSGNGSSTLIYPRIFEEVGCKVVEINAGIDGTFPSRPPEPRPELLTDLSKTVVKIGADFGVAYDADADRSLFCDEKGSVYWGDSSAAVLMKHLLKEGDVIVTPVSSSRLIEDVAKEIGVKVVWTKVGSIDVAYKMREIGAKFGAEENGGIFYTPHLPVRDGCMATLLMLEALAKMGKKLSELFEELPKYCIAKTKVECPNELKEKVNRILLERTKGYERITIDGAKLVLPKGDVLIRASWTEPIYRVYAEAKTKEDADEICSWAKKFISEIIEEAKRSD